MKSKEDLLKDLYDKNRVITINGNAFFFYRSDLVKQAMEEYASQFQQPKKETKTIEERKEDFASKVYEFKEGDFIPDQELEKFFDYWTEIGDNQKKMRFEKEKVFDIKKRLERWKRNQKNFNNGNKQQSTYEKHEQGFDALFGSGSPFSVPES